MYLLYMHSGWENCIFVRKLPEKWHFSENSDPPYCSCTCGLFSWGVIHPLCFHQFGDGSQNKFHCLDFSVLQTVVGGAGLSADSDAYFCLACCWSLMCFAILFWLLSKLIGAIPAGVRDCFLKPLFQFLLLLWNNWVWTKPTLVFSCDFKWKELQHVQADRHLSKSQCFLELVPVQKYLDKSTRNVSSGNSFDD